MKLLSPRKVADKLGVSEGALAQMRYMKTGPDYVRINSRNIMYRPEDVEAWILERTVASDTDRRR
jgi:predicted DNA-binding transcriptional regulator AlpA